MTKDVTGKTPGGVRQKMKDILPLETPLIFQVFPVYACCLKCTYCIFSKKKDNRNFISDKTHLNFKTYKKCIDDLKQFPDKVKVLRFVGIGEPLLHKNIEEMVMYANLSNIAERTEIITNAVMLNREKSDYLIQAGLDQLVVSLQGITSKKYKEVSNVELNVNNIVEQIRYYYENKKGHQKVYVKVADIALDNEEEKKLFYKTFENICDSYAIENIVPLHEGIDYLDQMKDKDSTQFNTRVQDTKICSVCLSFLQINPDGNIVNCYAWDYPIILGNVNKESVYDIWHSKKNKNFQAEMLQTGKDFNSICHKCTMFTYRASVEDIISEKRGKILAEKYKY